jgi:hypothetical protein
MTNMQLYWSRKLLNAPLTTSLVVGYFLIGLIDAKALELITEREAALPPLPQADLSFRAGVTRGPKAILVSPGEAETGVRSPLHFQIKFDSYPGVKADPATVKVTYLKSPVVDLTERLKGAITSDGIDVPVAEVPPGKHWIRIEMRDTRGLRSSGSFVLNVNR